MTYIHSPLGFYAGPEQWTPVREKAKAFKTSAEAIIFAHTKHVGTEVVLDICGNGKDDIIFAVNGGRAAADCATTP